MVEKKHLDPLRGMSQRCQLRKVRYRSPSLKATGARRLVTRRPRVRITNPIPTSRLYAVTLKVAFLISDQDPRKKFPGLCSNWNSILAQHTAIAVSPLL